MYSNQLENFDEITIEFQCKRILWYYSDNMMNFIWILYIQIFIDFHRNYNKIVNYPRAVPSALLSLFAASIVKFLLYIQENVVSAKDIINIEMLCSPNTSGVSDTNKI